MRTLLKTLILLISAFTISANPKSVPQQSHLSEIASVEEAQKYCDSSPLRQPEGIFIWVDAQTTVLIRKSPDCSVQSPMYEIIALESNNILIAPGQVLGYLSPSATPQDYHLYAYESIDQSGLKKPVHKAAKYNTDQHHIEIKEKQRAVNFNPLSLIPRLRSILRIRTTDPTVDIPNGLRRIYPSSASSLDYPRYL